MKKTLRMLKEKLEMMKRKNNNKNKKLREARTKDKNLPEKTYKKSFLKLLSYFFLLS